MASGVSDVHIRILSAGLRAGAVWYAGVGLTLAWVSTAQLQVATHDVRAEIATAASLSIVLLAAVLLVARVSRRYRPLRAIVAFVVAEVGFALFLQNVDLHESWAHTTAVFSLSLVKTTIVAMMINAGRRWGPPLAATLALSCTEAICIVIGAPLGYRWGFDAPEAVVLVLILVGAIAFAVARSSGVLARTAYDRARDEDALRQTRGIVRSKAAAIVHDTVLNDLAVLATTEPGPISPQLAARLSQTLDLLASPRWADESHHAPSRSDSGPVRAAIDQAIADGLSVSLSGDLGACDALDGAVERALAGAVHQCLKNTQRHAGTAEAELTVLSDAASVTVMVVDAGAGFDVSAVDADRLGIRGSVHARIEAVGGSVRIFAKPGQGTSILMTVPRSASRAIATVEG